MQKVGFDALGLTAIYTRLVELETDVVLQKPVETACEIAVLLHADFVIVGPVIIAPRSVQMIDPVRIRRNAKVPDDHVLFALVYKVQNLSSLCHRSIPLSKFDCFGNRVYYQSRSP